MAARLKAWKLAARFCDASLLYKAHLALWLLNTRAALEAADTCRNGDASAATLASAFGLTAAREERPAFTPPPYWPALTAEALHHIHEAALEILAPRLLPATARQLRGWLAVAEASAARDLPSRFARPIFAEAPAPLPLP